jgi:hypothetical protein
MTSLPATREAVTLPALLLTVALLGGLRIAPGMRLAFVPPPLIALVLGVMLLGLIVRVGLLAPERLVSPARTGLANANGVAVVAALLFASAQVFHMLAPEEGLLALLFNAFFLVLLWNTLAAGPDPVRLLRSLMVVFGSALVLKFVVVNGLAAPGGSLAKRLFAVAIEGVTLGALGARHYGPATGYAAFFMLALFFVALWLLPRREAAARGRLGPRPDDPAVDAVVIGEPVDRGALPSPPRPR